MAFSQYTTMSAEDAAAALHSSRNGLSDQDAAAQLKAIGPNAITAHQTTWRDILGRQFKSPFIYLLIVAGAISIALKEVIDGSLIFLFVIINAALGFYQEWRSEQALQLLQKFVASRATVKRNGEEKVVPSAELVPGDVVIFKAGDIITADMRLLEAEDLVIDESSLSGESAPTGKQIKALTAGTEDIYQATNVAFSGTTVSSGRGLGLVIATGNNTVIGEIGKLAVETKRTTTFEQEVGGFSRFILRLIVITIVIVFIANIVIKGHQANTLELIIFSVALAVSVIPEALPIVTTLAMSRGALRLAENKVVVKRLSAIEDLGSIEVLCTDKTGTLTKNELTVANILAGDHQQALLMGTVGDSTAEETEHQVNNSFDRALWQALDAGTRDQLKQFEHVETLPFDPERRRTTIVVKRESQYFLIARGAPETVLGLCGQVAPADRTKAESWIYDAGLAGQRTFAIAMKTMTQAPADDQIEHEQGLTWVGVIAFQDPLKPTALQSIAHAKELGVQVKILTGDGPAVAGAVGAEVKLIDQPTDVISGDDFMKLDEVAQAAAADRYHIFARMSPQQKHRVIEILEKKHQVGYLGEGINDAPALKTANVSIVVDSASDIARQNADVILLQQNLAVIIRGIELGREVFANTIKYIKATLLSNFGNFYSVAIASLLIPYLPMLPVQILLLNLLSDFPMITIAADTVDPMEVRTPKTYQVREIAIVATIFGLVSTLDDFIFFAVFSRIGPSALQTNWFIGSVLTELVVIFSIRTKLPFYKASKPAPSMIWFTGLAAVLTLILPYTALGKDVFHFEPPKLLYIVFTVLIVLFYLLLTEQVKKIYYRMTDARANQAKPKTV